MKYDKKTQIMDFKSIFKDWGFVNQYDFLQSTFHIDSIKPLLTISVTLGSVATMFKEVTGMNVVLYISFFLLLSLEFITGIKASLKEGKKIESKKFGRFIAKICTYTLMLIITNSIALSVTGTYMSYVYETLYWTIFHLITLQLIVSVFENLARLGFQESSKVFKQTNKMLQKYLELKNNKVE
jgi:hypothetical protein